jgi:glyoxylase-like metal-dependent hydrolase (beta-lactamase superfamily II)
MPHFDHIGFAEKARSELGVPVWIHENDVPLMHHPRQYAQKRPPSYYLATRLRAMPIIASLARSRAHTQPVVGLLATNGETRSTAIHVSSCVA